MSLPGNGYSSTVNLWLHIHGHRLPLAQIGNGQACLAGPQELEQQGVGKGTGMAAGIVELVVDSRSRFIHVVLTNTSEANLSGWFSYRKIFHRDRQPRVICCGSREWNNWLAILKQIERLPANTLIIHGACRGADCIAGRIAEAWELPKPLPFPVSQTEWNRLGSAAGPIRNKRMLDEGKPDVVLAFSEDIETTKGTKGMRRLAREAGVPVMVFTGRTS